MSPRRLLLLLALLVAAVPAGTLPAAAQSPNLTTGTALHPVQLDPGHAAPGATLRVTGHGPAFDDRVQAVSFEPGGVRVVRWQQPGKGQLVLELAIDAHAMPGPRTMVVTTLKPPPLTMTTAAPPPQPETKRYANVFTVDAPPPAPTDQVAPDVSPGLVAAGPAVVLDPNHGKPGERLEVVGTGRAFADRVQRVSFEPAGIEVLRLVWREAGRIQLLVQIDPHATPGPRTLVVTTQKPPPLAVTTATAAPPPETKRYPGVFTVDMAEITIRPGDRLPGGVEKPLDRLPGIEEIPGRQLSPLGPKVVRVQPGRVKPGATVELELFGANFRPGMSLDLGRDILVLQPIFILSGTRAKARIQVSPGAVPGPRVVRATAPGFTVAKGPATLMVGAGLPAAGVRPPGKLPGLVTGVKPPEKIVPLPSGPRVDRVVPDRFLPGQRYVVRIVGKNLLPGTRLSFGEGIRVVEAPAVARVRRGEVTIEVAPDARPGVRKVVAVRGNEKNEGPATVEVMPPIATGGPLRNLVPHGEIELVSPRDPWEEGCVGALCAPPRLDDGTVFSWRESNPGLADWFVLELLDFEGNVLARARTTKTSYRPNAAFLASLPADPPAPEEPAATPAGGSGDLSDVMSIPNLSMPAQAPASVSLAAGADELAAETVAAMKMPGTVFWKVTGYWKREQEGDAVVVEESETRPVRLPLPPRGAADCSVAPPGSNLLVLGTSAPPGEELPPACEGTVVCSGTTVHLGGTIDLSRSPYDPGGLARVNFGGPPSVTPVAFDNVFVDWGDLSAPEALQVAPTAAADLSRVELVGPDGRPLSHVYRAPGTYRVRIYTLKHPDEDMAEEIVPALGQGAAVAQGLQPVQPASGSAATAGSVAQAGISAPAGAGAVLDALRGPDLSDAFLVACTEIEVVAPPGAGADDFLHLLEAEVVWPDPWTNEDEPAISECSEAFRPGVRVTWYGHGPVRVSWYLDDRREPFAVTEPVGGLPGVSIEDGKAGRHPETIWLDAPLPAGARETPWRIRAVVEGGAPKKVDANDAFERSTRPPTQSAGSSGSGGATVPTLVPGLLQNPAAAGRQVLAGVGFSQAGDTGSRGPAFALDQSGVIAEIDKEALLGPHTEVETMERTFRVRARGEDEACALVFDTSRSGTIRITDLRVTRDGDTVSGEGILAVPLPDGSGGVTFGRVPVSFQGLTIGGTENGEWQVTAGSIDADAEAEAEAASFEVRVRHLRLDREALVLDGEVAPSDRQGLPASAGSSRTPAFAFSGAVVEPTGGFLVEAQVTDPVPAALGWSGIGLAFRRATLDFSTVSGEAPQAGDCAGVPGTAFVGVVADGELTLPTLRLGDREVHASPFSFTGWAIRPSGLAGVLDAGSWSEDLEFSGGVHAALGNLRVATCGGALDARLDVTVRDWPIIEEPVHGELRITADEGILSRFDPVSVRRDLGPLDLDVHRATFELDPELDEWVLSLEADLVLEKNGSESWRGPIDGARVSIDGKLLPPDLDDPWIPVDAARVEVAGWPATVRRIGILGSSDGFVVSLDTELDLADELMPQVTTVEHRYRSGRDVALGFLGQRIADLAPSFELPEGAPVVRGSATIRLETSGGLARWIGEGNLEVLGAAIDAGFVFGRSSGAWWLARAQVALPKPVTLGQSGLLLHRFRGGLGVNVDLNTILGPLEDVRPGPHGIVLSAGARVSTSDRYTMWADGDLSIRILGTAEARLDGGFWVLDGTPDGEAPLHACLRYGGGAFHASAWGTFRYLDDNLVIEAPAFGDPCNGGNAAVSLYFSGSDWHVYLGQEQASLRLRGEFLGQEVTGYMMLDPSGYRAGNSMHATLEWSGEKWGFGAHANIEANWEAKESITLHPPHLHGEFDTWVTVDAGLDTPAGCLCVNPGLWAHVKVDVPPPSFCARARIRFGRICWCIAGCCKTYEADIPEICLSL